MIYFLVVLRTVSSVGRALARHASGHWFKSSTVHHFWFTDQIVNYLEKVVVLIYTKSLLPYQNAEFDKVPPIPADAIALYGFQLGEALHVLEIPDPSLWLLSYRSSCFILSISRSRRCSLSGCISCIILQRRCLKTTRIYKRFQ